MDFALGLPLWSWDDSGLPSGPLIRLLCFFNAVLLEHGVLLETAQNPNFPFF